MFFFFLLVYSKPYESNLRRNEQIQSAIKQTKLVEDFIAVRQQAAMNRARGAGHIMGVADILGGSPFVNLNERGNLIIIISFQHSFIIIICIKLKILTLN